jgi:hypothetical protein
MRELRELSPHPERAEHEGWWQHQSKRFIQQEIFKDATRNREFILSLDPDLVYFVAQLWNSKANRDYGQWRYCLRSLEKYDETGEIAEAKVKWGSLYREYAAKREKGDTEHQLHQIDE